MPWGDCTGPWWAQNGGAQPPAGQGWGRGSRGRGRGRRGGRSWLGRIFFGPRNPGYNQPGGYNNRPGFWWSNNQNQTPNQNTNS